MKKKFKFKSEEKEMMIQKQKTLRLPDGRKLCYAEFGDPKGVPVMLIHGNPNSRLLYGLMPDCQATFIPNTGHFRIFEHMGDMLDVLVPPAGISELK